MAKVVGIDLGTSNSSIAVRELETRILKSAEGEEIVPSCVYFGKEDLDIIVGSKAKNMLKLGPESTIIHSKRLLGKSLQDIEVQKIITEKRYCYHIGTYSSGSINSLAIHLPDRTTKEVTPEVVSSLILKKLKKDAEKELGDEISHAVITVPAYFNDKQKHATLIAAKLAGLKVLRLISEPTAAAISFGIDERKGDSSETVMIFDFGGGTFDLSILTFGGENILEQAKGGDMWLGGADIDQMLTNMILQKAQNLDPLLEEALRAAPTNKLKRAMNELVLHAEAAKIALSDKEQTSVTIVDFFEDSDGIPLSIDVVITRDEFEAALLPLLDKIKPLVTNLLNDISLTANDIDNVLLVGGSSKMPIIKKIVDEFFGSKKVLLHPRPLLAIAEGASILAHRLSGTTDELTEVIYTTAHDYFLKDEQDQYHLLISRNSILPTSCKLTLSLKKGSNQSLVHFPFANKIGDGYESIGDLWLSFDLTKLNTEEITDEGLTYTKSKDISIELCVEIDENNLFKASASVKEDPFIAISKNISRGYADEVLFKQLEEDLKEVDSMRNYFSHYEFEKKIQTIVKSINDIIDSETGTINETNEKLARHQLDLTMKLSRKNEHIFANISYVEQCISNYKYYNPGEKVLEIKKLKLIIKSLNDMIYSGDYDDIIDKRDEMLSECRNTIPHQFCHSMDMLDIAHEVGRKDLASKLKELRLKFLSAENEKIKNKLMEKITAKENEIYEIFITQDHKIETGFTLNGQTH